jgi:hypothetical protein
MVTIISTHKLANFPRHLLNYYAQYADGQIYVNIMIDTYYLTMVRAAVSASAAIALVVLAVGARKLNEARGSRARHHDVYSYSRPTKCVYLSTLALEGHVKF